jgi:pimeloyl-ACP methyl ester carboxylesterase
MLGTVVLASAIAIIAIALFFFAAFVTARFFFVERSPDEVHFADTSDDWRVAVYRYRPRAPLAGAPPVLLVPGIGMNALVFDLADDLSLARYLAAAGHDVWALDLRGRGWSTRPRMFSQYRYDWSFDEYVERDMPAAIDAVRRATGAPRVVLVGYSLGGVVTYGYLGGAGRERADVAAAVAIAAPVTFTFQQRYLRFWPLRKLRWLRHRQLMRLLAPLAGYWQPTTVQLVHNAANLSGEVLRRVMANVAVSFARNELLQLSDWIDGDVLRSIDHRRDYRKDLAGVQVPMLFIAGNRDLLAPPKAMKAAHDAIGSPDKTFAIASRGKGLEANYGHLDLMVGERAADDIYPVIRKFLDEQAAGEVGERRRAAARS